MQRLPNDTEAPSAPPPGEFRPRFTVAVVDRPCLGGRRIFELFMGAEMYRSVLELVDAVRARRANGDVAPGIADNVREADDAEQAAGAPLDPRLADPLRARPSVRDGTGAASIEHTRMIRGSPAGTTSAKVKI
jgi:hypothetical protein